MNVTDRRTVTIEEIIAKYARLRRWSNRWDPDEGMPVGAQIATKWCETLLPHQRASLDVDSLVVLDHIFAKSEEFAWRRDILKQLDALPWFARRRSPELERTWITAAIVLKLASRSIALRENAASNDPDAATWATFAHVLSNKVRSLIREEAHHVDFGRTQSQVLHEVLVALGKRKLKLTPEQVLISLECSLRGERTTSLHHSIAGPALDRLSSVSHEVMNLPGAPVLLAQVRNAIAQWTSGARERAWLAMLDDLLPSTEGGPVLRAGEDWADSITADLGALSDQLRPGVRELLRHAGTLPTQGKPSQTWRHIAIALSDKIGRPTAIQILGRWLGFFIGAEARMPADDPYRRSDDKVWNASHAAGLVIVAGLVGDPKLLSCVADVAMTVAKSDAMMRMFRARVANAAIRALEMSDDPAATACLSRLSLRLRWPKLRKAVDKAFDAHLARRGLSRDEAEEAGVPDFALRDGTRRITFAGTDSETYAELSLGPSDRPRVSWVIAGKPPARAVPRSLKQSHREAVDEVAQLTSEIEKTRAAQRTRLDLLFRRRVSWPYATWRERYLDHGLIATLARRFIWTINGQALLYVATAWEDVGGRTVTVPDNATVAMWHPAERPADEVRAWRQRLEELGITQPIKQAHREVYLLTDAERRTATYSNRFAAHILRNHTAMALSQVRKWTMGLYGGQTSSPKLVLPHFGLRAEWWVEAAGDQHDRMGFPLYVATDQVRFYRGDERHPMPIDQVDPLALSEVMRDVDLFVGVASVGNDPTWQDGGPQGRFRDYWQSYSFGDLTETAKTRKVVLDRLVPRLKIAERCTLSDKFLVVRGELRTYKIHLGSGNILMEPNDQYLCIVPDRSTKSDGGNVFLPFEGDQTLSLILSKAMLLAEDRKITDPTIVRQINV